MKIVINDCFGGFQPSDEACKALIKLGMKMTTNWDEKADIHYTKGETFMGEYSIINDDVEFRKDPRLIQVVEELKEKANSNVSHLKVIEIPDDIEVIIEEYDGLEHVAEAHETWG